MITDQKEEDKKNKRINEVSEAKAESKFAEAPS
jgi:hypothetical protein